MRGDISRVDFEGGIRVIRVERSGRNPIARMAASATRTLSWRLQTMRIAVRPLLKYQGNAECFQSTVALGVAAVVIVVVLVLECWAGLIVRVFV